MTRVSTIDSGFLLTESPHSPKHVASLMIFELPRGKGPAWLRRLLARMKQQPAGYPFNQRLYSRGGVFFEFRTDPLVDLDYHVRHTVLPRPGSDAQLRELVARLHANLLDRDRPLWECHLIEGLQGRRFALYVKIHHTLSDGTTFRRWIDDFTATTPRGRSSCAIWARPPEPASEAPGPPSLLQAAADVAHTLEGGAKTTLGVAGLASRMLRRRFLGMDDRIALPLSAPHTPLNVETGAARTLAFTAFPLAELRAIGKARGATINDVVMTLCDMAASHYLEQHGGPPRGSLVVYMPVDVRTREDDGEGNLVTLLQVKLASTHADALTWLDEVRESIASARELFSGASRSALQYYSLLVALAGQAEEWLKLGRWLPPVNNLVVSNVPGSRVTRYLAGARAVAMYPVSTLPPLTALNVTCCSYDGVLYFGLVAGRTAMPDLPLLAGYLEEAYRQLGQATGVLQAERKSA